MISSKGVVGIWGGGDMISSKGGGDMISSEGWWDMGRMIEGILYLDDEK